MKEMENDIKLNKVKVDFLNINKSNPQKERIKKKTGRKCITQKKKKNIYIYIYD